MGVPCFHCDQLRITRQPSLLEVVKRSLTIVMYRVACLEDLREAGDAKHDEYLDQAVSLLNSEWPISNTARRHMLSSPGRLGLTRHLVLLDGDQVIAHAAACESNSFQKVSHSQDQETERKVNVTSVLVDSSKRGQGLGSSLMHSLESRIGQDFGGESNVRICLDAKNQRAMEFYKKLGYTVIASPKGSIADSQQADVACKSIVNENSGQPSPPVPPPPPPIASVTVQRPFGNKSIDRIPMFKLLKLV